MSVAREPGSQRARNINFKTRRTAFIACLLNFVKHLFYYSAFPATYALDTGAQTNSLSFATPGHWSPGHRAFFSYSLLNEFTGLLNAALIA
jgi:hypothetical protein